ncbi:tetratricopeptide repeat protein [Streptomyces sp. NPDC002643]
MSEESEENERRVGRGASRGKGRRRGLWAVAFGCAVVGGVVLGGAVRVVPPDGGGGDGGRGAGAVEPAVTGGAAGAVGAVGAVGAPGPQGRAAEAVRARVVRAGVPMAASDLSAVIREREGRVRARPRDHGSWAVLGTAYVERARRAGAVTDYPKAARALRRSLTLRPHENAAAVDGMAALATARRDFATARDWAERAVRDSPGRWTSYVLLIDAYDGLGRYRDAREILGELLELEVAPGAAAAVRARAASVYWDEGRREDAASAITDAAISAETPAEEAAWWVRAGELAWERGEAEASLRYCGTAGRLIPGGDAEAEACRGRALAALGRAPEGVRAYRASLALRPSPQVALRLGELYEALGREEAARKQYGVVRALVRASAAAGVNDSLVLGALEADHGDPEVAVRVLREEWRRQPGLGVADALGWALHRAGEDEEALRYALRATDRGRGGEVRSAVRMHRRGEIEQALGLSASARRHLEEAGRINPYVGRGAS